MLHVLARPRSRSVSSRLAGGLVRNLVRNLFSKLAARLDLRCAGHRHHRPRAITGAVMALMLVAQAGLSQTSQYAAAGPWALFRTVDAGQVTSCHATMTVAPDQGMIFDHTSAFTAFGFMGPDSGLGAGTEIDIWFDGDRSGMQRVAMPPEGEWRVYRTPNSEPDGLLDLFANSTVVSFGYIVPGRGAETVTYSLQGSNAMMGQTYDCVQNAQAAPAPAPRRYDWIAASSAVPGAGVVTAGTMPDGMPVYVCAVHHRDGFHPGMTGFWTDRCSIGFNGQEYQGSGFFYLSGVGRWRAFDGTVPGDAVEGGQEADGRKLYICRVMDQGAALAGKYRPGFRGCNIGDGGSEVSHVPFDLLTF